MRSASLLLSSVLLSASCGADLRDAPVRATLADGQILVGVLQTPTLQLQTGFGLVQVPLDDIGEVQPVEGGALGGAGDNVSVWLRNGSELRGAWTEPELAVGLRVDDRIVGVDLPMDDLQRLQLLGGDLLPDGMVYRVETVYGDDFVVDADATWVRLDNELGSFSPTLGEVRTLWFDGADPVDTAPVGATPGGGDDRLLWRMELDTGTVLRGELSGSGADPDALVLALPLGPGTLTVPIADIVRIERQDWGGYDSFLRSRTSARESGPTKRGAPDPEVDGAGDSGGWFDNRGQLDFKSTR